MFYFQLESRDQANALPEEKCRRKKFDFSLVMLTLSMFYGNEIFNVESSNWEDTLLLPPPSLVTGLS